MYLLGRDHLIAAQGLGQQTKRLGCVLSGSHCLHRDLFASLLKAHTDLAK